MKYSRRHFLKAAGTSAVVLTTVGGCAERSLVGRVAAPESDGPGSSSSDGERDGDVRGEAEL